MLRQVYFLSLLLCINISFCYDYLPKKELNIKQANRKFRDNSKRVKGKINRNQGDDEMLYDKKPLAQIDVASFILDDDISPKNDFQMYAESHDENFKSQGTNYDSYGSLFNVNDGVQDYKNLDFNSIPEVNILHGKNFVPQNNIHLNDLSPDEINTENFDNHKINLLKNNKVLPLETKSDHISRTEKKCALNNMKFPFFSHNKPASTAEKKSKKRKLFNFHKKQTTMHPTQRNSLDNNVKTKATSQDLHKINKRSYFQRLCPICKQKFLKNSDSNLLDKRQKNINSIIHNSRQYYQRKKYNNPRRDEFDKPCNIEVKPSILYNNVKYMDTTKERRCKRDDETIEDKQKKVLEEIEKKVESVKVSNLRN